MRVTKPAVYCICQSGFHASSLVLYTAGSLTLFHCISIPSFLQLLFYALVMNSLRICYKRQCILCYRGCSITEALIVAHFVAHCFTRERHHTLNDQSKRQRTVSPPMPPLQHSKHVGLLGSHLQTQKRDRRLSL